MRFIFKVSIPVEAGNKQAREGFKTLTEILDQIRPEAAYFYAENGMRTGLLIVHMNDLSEIPAIAEPFFLGMNASIDVYPAMTPADLQKAGPAIASAVQKYGK